MPSADLLGAAVGVGVALVPDNVVPAELQPNVRHLKRPLVRELTAYTRSEWSPAARAFVEVLRGLSWGRRPRNAEVISSLVDVELAEA